jgi:hypothetical protein
MKKYLFLCLLVMCYGINLSAQVKIGGVAGAPPSSAVLELDGGTNKGLLLPRMTKQNMNDIQNPVAGLSVFVTDEQAVYLRRNDGWVKQITSIESFSLPYFGAFNTDGSSFEVHNLNGGSALSGYATGLASIAVRGNTLNGVGIGGYATTGIGAYFNANANGKALITGLGRVGIGTASPTAVLHVDGTGQSGNTLTINDDQDPLMLLQKAGIATSFIQTLGNDFKLGTALTNPAGSFIVRTGNADRLFLNNAGLLGIGNPSADARLYVDATNSASTAMILNDENPTIQFQQDGVNKGVLQLNGDDIRLATNATNSSANIVFRTSGVDHAKMDSDGKLHLGETYGENSTLNIRSTGAINSGISLVGDFGSNYGPGIRFWGAQPVHTPFGSIRAVTGNMEITSAGTTDRGLKLRVGGGTIIDAMTIKGSNGYIGMGTNNPVSLLHIDGYRNGEYIDGEIARIQGFNPIMQFVNINSNVGFIQVSGGDFKIGTNINNSGDLIFRTAGADRVFVKNNGKFFIGGDLGFSSEFALAAKGKIAGSEFVVKTVASWPDYVFADDYKLKSLEETEAFIKANKHLPNIPAAAVIEKEGFALGDMQKRMMEKIEELTLHLIAANKAIKELSASGVEAQHKISQLQNQIQALDNKK